VSPSPETPLDDRTTSFNFDDEDDQTGDDGVVSPKIPFPFPTTHTHLAPPPTTSGGRPRQIKTSEALSGDVILPLPSTPLMGRSPQLPRSKSVDSGRRKQRRNKMTAEERKLRNRISAERTRESIKKELADFQTKVEELESEITHLKMKLDNSSKFEQENEMLKKSLKKLLPHLEHLPQLTDLQLMDIPRPPLYQSPPTLYQPPFVSPYPSSPPVQGRGPVDQPIRALPLRAVVSSNPTPPMGQPTLVTSIDSGAHHNIMNGMHTSTTLSSSTNESVVLHDYDIYHLKPRSLNDTALPLIPLGLATSPHQQFVTGHPFNLTTSATSPHQPSSPDTPATHHIWTLPNLVTTNVVLSREDSSYPTSASLTNPSNNNTYYTLSRPQQYCHPSSPQPQYLANPPQIASGDDLPPPRPEQWTNINDLLSYVDRAFVNRIFSEVLGSNNGEGGEAQTNGNDGPLHAAPSSLILAPSSSGENEGITRSFSELLSELLLKESFSQEDPSPHTGG